MKDLAKNLYRRCKTREVVYLIVAALALFTAGRTIADVEAYGSAFRAAERLSQPSLAASTPTTGTKPLRSFVCLSSWYGGDFDGQLTATGEIYDMYGHTAAHPTLPLGSVVRVVNLRTRKSAIVRINDRGPYVPGRDLDVSYQVARELGFAQRGTARVRVELLKVPPSKSVHPGN